MMSPPPPKYAVGDWDALGAAADFLSTRGPGGDGGYIERAMAWWSEPAVFVAGSAAYLLLVWALRRAMDARAAPMKLAGAMRVYNAVQVLINSLLAEHGSLEGVLQ